MPEVYLINNKNKNYKPEEIELSLVTNSLFLTLILCKEIRTIFWKQKKKKIKI